MKTKTRIFAMLLTVLMVAGLLPLTLFAADVQGTVGSTVQAPYEERMLDDIKKELGKVGFNVKGSQDFSSLSSLTQGNNDNNSIRIANPNGVFSIENGILKRNQTVTTSHYLQCLGNTDINNACNFYVSVDVKMGDTIVQTIPFTFVSRKDADGNYASSGTYTPTSLLYIDKDGTVRLGDKGDVVGKISSDGYTRFSVSTDRTSGKIYAYINDVLVTPNGVTWNTPAALESIRFMVAATTGDEKDALYIDNIVFAYGYASRTVANDSVKFESDFANAVAGNAVAPGGTINNAAFGTVNGHLGGSLDASTVVYVDDNGEKAIQFKNSSAGDTYLQASGNGSSNLSISFDVKLGSELPTNNRGFITVIFRDKAGTRNRRKVLQLSDGKSLISRHPDDENTSRGLGVTLSSEKYYNVRLDIITDGFDGKAVFLYYVDNELKYVSLSTDYQGDAMDIESIRIFNLSGSSFKGEQIKNIKFKVTGQYSKVINPFVTEYKPSGFHIGIDGIERYYNGDGTYKTENFELGGIHYLVGSNGAILGSCNGVDHIMSDKTGACMGCGAKVDGVTALYGTSLILGSDVKVVFYLDIDTELLGDGAYLEVGLARDYASGTTEKLYLSGDDYTVEIGGETYFKVVYSVSAKDIYSDITVTPVAANGAKGTQYVYSAADYAEGVQLKQTDEVYTENLKALAKALLVYGKNAAAALVPDAEAAEEITEAVDWSGVTIPDGFKDLYQAIILDTVTLELKSNIKLKVYFTFNSGNFGMKTLANYTFKVDGEEVEYTDLGDGKYCIEKEMVAANLDEVYTFEIVDPIDGTGLCVKMSALYYAKIMAANANAPEGYANLMKAIKLYSDVANAYTPEIAEDVRPAV